MTTKGVPMRSDAEMRSAQGRGELLGPYEWNSTPPMFKGLAAVAAGRGVDHPNTLACALIDAYKRIEDRLPGCTRRRVREDGRIGRCVRPAGHDGHEDACRILLLSLADSRAILAGMRRVVEPDPIPEVGPPFLAVPGASAFREGSSDDPRSGRGEATR